PSTSSTPGTARCANYAATPAPAKGRRTASWALSTTAPCALARACAIARSRTTEGAWPNRRVMELWTWRSRPTPDRHATAHRGRAVVVQRSRVDQVQRPVGGRPGGIVVRAARRCQRAAALARPIPGGDRGGGRRDELDALAMRGAGRAGGPAEDPRRAHAGEEHPVETGVPRTDRGEALLIGHQGHDPSEPRPGLRHQRESARTTPRSGGAALVPPDARRDTGRMQSQGERPPDRRELREGLVERLRRAGCVFAEDEARLLR